MSRQSYLERAFKGKLKLLTSTQKLPLFPEFLYRATDKRSIEEAIKGHADDLVHRKLRKNFFTSDYETITIAREVLKTASASKKKGGSTFFEDNIFSQPVHSTGEVGSLEIRISDIGDFPEYKRKFEEKRGAKVMLCVGGPAAEDQTVLSSIISQIRSQLDYIVYLTKDYRESNVNHAAKQSHARHGNALNADPTLTGHALLPTLVLRALIGVTSEEAIEADYKKIDVPFTIDPKKLRIYFENELNYLKQSYRKHTGRLTEHDINRLESILSQEILGIVEKEAGIKLSGGIDRAFTDSSSIHVSFSEKNARGVEHENEDFKSIGIESERLKLEEIDFFFGEEGKKHIHSAWKYKGDSHIKFDAHERNKVFAEENGVQWVEGQEIQRIMVTRNKEGKAKFAGVVTKTGEYIYGSESHFTLGYKAKYIFDHESEARKEASFARRLVNKLEDVLGLQPPLVSEITTATGVSVNAVFKKSDRMKKVIEKYGSTGEIAVTNSHWTMIAQNKDHVVMRITGGGNTGSEEYNPSYFLNVIANTRRIFGDDLVGVLSAYGCPRAVNSRNSTEFSKLAEGIVVSYGKGGTGNTKRHAEAVTALLMTGFEKEVVDYFNKFQSRAGLPLGDKISEIHKHLMEVEFIHDSTKRTNRRMGYDNSFSTEEMIAVALLLAATSYVSKKKLTTSSKKAEEVLEDSDESKEINTSLKATSASKLSATTKSK
jgi:hypothetical protein